MKRSVFLLGINAKFIHTTLSLYYLKRILTNYNYNVTLFQTTINNPYDEILCAIKAIQPHVCCIAVYIWNALYIKALLPVIHTTFPDCKIVLGGPEVSYTSDMWVQEFPFIETIVQGHGERSFEYLVQNDFTLHDKIISLPNYHFNNIPFPYSTHDLQQLSNRYVYYESSRGCPFTCTYCLSSRQDQQLQFKDLPKVFDELSILLQHNVRMVKFVDRTFNCNPTHSRAIFHYLLKNNNHRTQFHFEIHPNLLNEEDFIILKEAPPGLFQFEIGIQSIHDNSLKAIRRTMKWHKAKENIQRLLALENIHIHLDMICGLPYEDLQGIKESFNEIVGVNPHYFQMGFLKVLPGTLLDTQKDQFGIEHERVPPYTIIQNRWLTKEEIALLHRIERVVDSLYNHHFKTASLFLDKFIAKGNMFDIYKRIANFFYENNFVLYAKSFEVIAGMLIKFIQREFPSFTEPFIDCLRWDWFIKGQRWIPPVIRGKSNPHTAKELIIHSHRISKHELSLNNIKIPLHELKRAPIFIAETPLFKEWRMDNHRYAIKLHNGTIVYIE